MTADQPTGPLPLAQALPLLSKHLRREAENVRNIGYGRSTPEKIIEKKYDIAARLERLAGLIDATIAKAEEAPPAKSAAKRT